MEHAMENYLKRLPQEKLEAFLQDYMNENQREDFTNIIGLIVQEIARRKNENSK